MGAKAEQGKYRPFHETIVDAINITNDQMGLVALGVLIMQTKIPKNHDAIILAWDRKTKLFDIYDPNSVIESLLEQKKAVETFEGKAS